MPALTVKDLLEKSESIGKIAYPDKGCLDIYTAFKLKDFVAAVTTKLQDIEKSRHSFYEQYGDKDEKGNINVRVGEAETFKTAWEEFLTGEVVLPNVTPIPIGKFAKVGLTPVDLNHLDFLIVGEDEPSAK